MLVNISLVIPAYNEEKRIGKCLESVAQQEEAPYEVIVVDNNSTDSTAEIARNYPVRIVSEPQQGIISARNRGFDEVCGDIIARCDADTILPPDWTTKIMQNFSLFSIDALTGPVGYYDLPLKTTVPVHAYLLFVKLLQGGKESLLGPNMALTKKIWERVRDSVCLDDTIVHEDLDLARQILRVGGSIRRDRGLVCFTSARRITHNPVSFFCEYPVRFVKTFVR